SLLLARRRRLALDPLDKGAALLAIGSGQRLDDVQPLEGVTRVEDAWREWLLLARLADVEDTLAISAIDRRAADHHWEGQVAAIQLGDAGGHLLGRADQQRREADHVGV